VGSIDMPSVPASLSTQSTVRNTSQLDSGDQTITDMPDHHRANQQEWLELTPSSLMGQGKLGSMRKGSTMTEDANSQRSVSSASMSMAEGHRHTRTLQSQLRVPLTRCREALNSHRRSLDGAPYCRKLRQEPTHSAVADLRKGILSTYIAEHSRARQTAGGLPAGWSSPSRNSQTDRRHNGLMGCTIAGLGFFFEIKGPYKRRGGALLAVYYGQDSYTRKFSKHSHKQLTELWSRVALFHRGANYVVNGDPACGPAYINDGFDTVNVYFSYSKANRRMEVRTREIRSAGQL
jgi:hypothetical protein